MHSVISSFTTGMHIALQYSITLHDTVQSTCIIAVYDAKCMMQMLTIQHFPADQSDDAGMNKISDQQMAQAEKQQQLWESMINSMTPHERETPEVLASTPSRRRRIARGSGRKELDVSNMIAMFTQMRSRMRDMSKLMKMTGAQGESECDAVCFCIRTGIMPAWVQMGSCILHSCLWQLFKGVKITRGCIEHYIYQAPHGMHRCGHNG